MYRLLILVFLFWRWLPIHLSQEARNSSFIGSFARWQYPLARWFTAHLLHSAEKRSCTINERITPRRYQWPHFGTVFHSWARKRDFETPRLRNPSNGSLCRRLMPFMTIKIFGVYIFTRFHEETSRHKIGWEFEWLLLTHPTGLFSHFFNIHCLSPA